MEEVAKNKWRELCEKLHGKEKVTWMHVARALSYTWDNAVWLGRMTEYRLLMVIARSPRTATTHQIRAIESLVESSFELDDPGEIEKVIEYAACTFDDHWEAQVDKEFVTELAVSVVEANHKKLEKEIKKPNEAPAAGSATSKRVKAKT